MLDIVNYNGDSEVRIKVVITADLEEEYSKNKTKRDIEEDIQERLLQELLPICDTLTVTAIPVELEKPDR